MIENNITEDHCAHVGTHIHTKYLLKVTKMNEILW